MILPGGFSYGDYLRCGAIAKFSPVMAAVRKFAADGGLVLGICNGFQILVESGLLPGALIRNRGAQVRLPRGAAPRSETIELAIHRQPRTGPDAAYAHRSWRRLLLSPTSARWTNSKLKIASRSDTSTTPTARCGTSPACSTADRNVMGMMPHPERATEPLMGSSDGLRHLRVHGCGSITQSSDECARPAITPELIASHQLSPDEYDKIVSLLGREPNYTELGIFSVMWSEHCSYKSSRLHLKKLPTRGKIRGAGAR